MSILQSKGSHGFYINSKHADTAKFPLNETLVKSLSKVAKKLASFTALDFICSELTAPATHLLNNQGKLLRPALVLLGSSVIGEEQSEFVDLAVAAELLHTASLVHDDLIDGDVSRRGVDAVHVKFGKEAAILAGDALIAKAILIASRYGQKVMDEMANSAMAMCEGELIDYECQKLGKIPTLDTYLKIAKFKTGAFIGTCCGVAALYKNNPMDKRLSRFGSYMGLAFQIRDDLSEISDAEGKKAGKTQSIISIIMAHEGVTREAAVEKAIALNNYFYKKALSQIKDEAVEFELDKYASFIRA